MPAVSTQTCPAAALLAAMRPHQWVKNLLVFLPMILAHQLTDPWRWFRTVAAFAALSAIASAVYLINDVLDLPADRRHPTKRLRPCASGRLGVPQAVAGAALLSGAGILLAALWVPRALPALLGYFALTFLYSLGLKRLPAVDVICLSLLYLARMAIGGAAAQVNVSRWLLAFAFFVFASLALAKRHAELAERRGEDSAKVPGRGYAPKHQGRVWAAGAASGAAGIAVFFAYVHASGQAAVLYRNRTMLVAAGLVLAFWTARLWRRCARSELGEDPVLFAIKDRISWICGALVAISFALAA